MDEQLGGLNPTYVIIWLAFNAWMVIDAVRRRAESYWYFVILFFPLGALLYFFIVKLRDVSADATAKSAGSVAPTSVPSEQSAAQLEKPDLNYADKLEENENYVAAEPLFRKALEEDPSNKQALHGLGRCLVGLGRAREALVPFERLLELEREYRDYSVALEYADALWEAGQRTDTVELLEHLAELTGRINHRLALGHYLAESGNTERARQAIKLALESAAQNPETSSERVRLWMNRGEQMLAALEKSEAPN